MESVLDDRSNVAEYMNFLKIYNSRGNEKKYEETVRDMIAKFSFKTKKENEAIIRKNILDIYRGTGICIEDVCQIICEVCDGIPYVTRGKIWAKHIPAMYLPLFSSYVPATEDGEEVWNCMLERMEGDVSGYVVIGYSLTTPQAQKIMRRRAREIYQRLPSTKKRNFKWMIIQRAPEMAKKLKVTDEIWDSGEIKGS